MAAGWLKRRSGHRPRRWVPALLALPVLLLHLWLGETVQRLRQDWGEAAAPEPPRLTVAYVREMKREVKREPKPAAAAPVAIARPAPQRAQTEPMPAPPAEPEVAASAPEPEPIAASPEAILAEPALPASAPASAAVTAQPEPEPGPEWPLSTRLSYSLEGNYRGPVSGSASVEWIRRGRHYQVHLELAIGPSFAPLISRRMSSDGLLTALGIAPQRYDEDTRVMFAARRHASVLFQGDSLTLANGRVEPAPPGAQDAASQFVHLTWLFLTGREALRVGQVVEMPLVLPRRQYRWRYVVLGEQQLQTPMGPLATWHLKPSQPAYAGDLTAEVWLAPSLQYLPVRLLVRQDAETYIDLLLSSTPLQESIVKE